MTVASAEGLM
uniref:Uncharacterized protein n=1 Tax=Arundo donax TaxID=35708 RepID=A0A0A9AB29_ARUDO